MTPAPPHPIDDPPVVLEGLRIESMSHGPDGVGRYQGRVVFVRDTAPGDVVDARITERRATYSRAVRGVIRAPAAGRREPPCPYVGRCGGCQWQHLAYAAQLAAKHRNLVDHLSRIGGLDPSPIRPVLPAPEEWRYRHRINLRVQDRRLGFYRAESHELVEIDACLIAAAPVDAALGAARRWLDLVDTRIRRLSLVASEEGGPIVLVANAEGALAPGDHARNLDLVRRVAETGVRGVVMHGKGWRKGWGDVHVSFVVDGIPILTTAGEFTQVNLAANRHLAGTVAELAAIEPGDDVLDLYCGAGNLAIPAARRGAEVLGIERSARAVADAHANARRLGLERCRFVCAPVERALRELTATPGVVILDPPRGGAAPIMQDLLRLRARRVVYVSCDPPTLARDVAALVDRGYRLQAVQPLDLFPQTYHLEAVACLSAA
jgi:23S rRNA (uracil1939-C5)-methyltransferase